VNAAVRVSALGMLAALALTACGSSVARRQSEWRHDADTVARQERSYWRARREPGVFVTAFVDPPYALAVWNLSGFGNSVYLREQGAWRRVATYSGPPIPCEFVAAGIPSDAGRELTDLAFAAFSTIALPGWEAHEHRCVRIDDEATDFR
jgi:hypothetical protein